MFIPSKITNNFGVSIIKRNSKISLCIACKNKNGEVVLLKDVDKDFPFSNPLVTNNAVKTFEFIVETNNYINRELEKRKNIN